MKRRLNLNDVGGRLVLIAIFLGLLVLLTLYGASVLLRLLAVSAVDLYPYMRVSALAGGVLLTLLMLLLAVELVQDAAFDRWYRRQRRARLNLPDGGYECQYCGNRLVAGDDRRCAVCGKELA